MNIFTELAGLLETAMPGIRVYPGKAGDSPPLPYVVYGRVIGVPENVMTGNGGSNPLTNTRLQIDLYSPSYGAVHDMAASVRAALLGWSVQNVTNSEQDLHEDDVKLHRVMIDISTWHN